MAAAAAVAVFGVSWTAIHFWFFADNHVVDTPVYQRYGDAIVGGHVPYRDFTVEYPPGALPTFVIPSLVAGRAPTGTLPALRDRGRHRRDYEAVFDALMGACGAALVALVALTLVADGAGDRRLAFGTALAALAPVALGSVLLTRFDLWPAAIVAAALLALLGGRELVAFGALGLGVATKVFPIVLLPIFAAFVWKRAGPRRAWLGVAAAAAVVALVVLPFVGLSPGGAWDSSLRQTARPLQVETLGAGFLLAAHQAFGLGISEVSSYGSQNLAGSLPDALALAQAAVEGLVIVAIWIWFARGPAGRPELLRACAAALCAFVAFGKVLSPQFLVWLVPVVALVRGRRGLAAGVLLAASLVLTQLWFPYRYWELALGFAAFPSWLVLVRDLVLVVLLGVLVWPERPWLERPWPGDSPWNGSRTRASRD